MGVFLNKFRGFLTGPSKIFISTRKKQSIRTGPSRTGPSSIKKYRVSELVLSENSRKQLCSGKTDVFLS